MFDDIQDSQAQPAHATPEAAYAEWFHLQYSLSQSETEPALPAVPLRGEGPNQYDLDRLSETVKRVQHPRVNGLQARTSEAAGFDTIALQAPDTTGNLALPTLLSLDGTETLVTSVKAIYSGLSPAPSAKVRVVALPDFAGPDADILEELIQFGTKHWPAKCLEQFRPGELVGGHMLTELARNFLATELKSYKYALGYPAWIPQDLAQSFGGIVWLQNNKTGPAPSYETEQNHISIAVADLQARTFISWGMGDRLHYEGKVGFEIWLGYDLKDQKLSLPDFSGNMSAFRCLEVVHEYCTGSPTPAANNVSVRLQHLKKFLASLVHANSTDIPPTAASLLSRSQSTNRKRPAFDQGYQFNAGEALCKKRDKETPPGDLAEELTGPRAIARMRKHLRSCKLDTNRQTWKTHRNWGDNARDALKISDSLDSRDPEFLKVVTRILKTHVVRVCIQTARVQMGLDDNEPDPRLSTSVIDEVCPELRDNITSENAFRRWLSLTRKLEKLGDYLPFLPHGGGSHVTFQSYERMAKDNMHQLLTCLGNDALGKRVAMAGRAFRNYILYRNKQKYVWEMMKDEELDRLSDSDFLDMIPKTIQTANLSVVNNFGDIFDFDNIFDFDDTIDDDEDGNEGDANNFGDTIDIGGDTIDDDEDGNEGDANNFDGAIDDKDGNLGDANDDNVWHDSWLTNDSTFDHPPTLDNDHDLDMFQSGPPLELPVLFDAGP